MNVGELTEAIVQYQRLNSTIDNWSSSLSAKKEELRTLGLAIERKIEKAVYTITTDQTYIVERNSSGYRQGLTLVPGDEGSDGKPINPRTKLYEQVTSYFRLKQEVDALKGERVKLAAERDYIYNKISEAVVNPVLIRIDDEHYIVRRVGAYDARWVQEKCRVDF